ncbi:MAG: lambda exonuclease family protein [Candidatus Hydrothermarchaeales archaeon]
MIQVDVEQMSIEWFALKAGVPSASNFDKIVTSKGEPSKQRDKYMHQLAGERITKFREEGYQSEAMARGIAMETEAVRLYELITGLKADKVGVCYQNEEKACLCSPDRLILGDSVGVLEIKCPLLHTHVEYLLKNKLPTTYFQQVQGQIFITGAEWCDFMSYYPGIKPLIIRVERDPLFAVSLEKHLDVFCKELQGVVEKIR